MYYLDTKYLNLVSPKLDGFTQKKNDLWATRCPYCGDSIKKKTKKRGYFYKKGDGLFYKCFNCEISTTFFKALQYLDGSLAKEYSLERFTSGSSKHGNYTKPKTKTFKKPVFERSEWSIPSVNTLGDDNIAKSYVLGRKIPKGQHKNLFYASDFKKFVQEIFPKYEKTLIDDDPRLIIPFKDENGVLFALQGRSLTNNPLRYITIKIDEDKTKLFGLDRVNRKETILVVESPIDSLFLKNSVATADSNLEIASKYFEGKDTILIPDKEPRNIHICKNIQKYIDNGRKICLLPETLKGKDINEFILNGVTKPQLEKIILENTFQGLEAKLKFNNWKKV